MAKEKYYWKGVEIFPYDTFSWQDSKGFFRGSIGVGYSRAISAQHLLAILVKYEKKNNPIK